MQLEDSKQDPIPASNTTRLTLSSLSFPIVVQVHLEILFVFSSIVGGVSFLVFRMISCIFCVFFRIINRISCLVFSVALWISRRFINIVSSTEAQGCRSRSVLPFFFFLCCCLLDSSRLLFNSSLLPILLRLLLSVKRPLSRGRLGSRRRP